MKVVDNGIVKMEWDADLFLDNKYIGFIAAGKQYGDVTVMFSEGSAYTLYDEENPFTPEEVVNTVKKSYKITKGKEASKKREYSLDEFDEYLLLATDGEVYEGNLAVAGLGKEEGEDILKRLEDIHQYYEEDIVDM